MPDHGEREYLDDDHRAISEFADGFLDEDEREEFVDGLMERRGYKRVSSWAPPDPDDDDGKGRRPLVKPRKSSSSSGARSGFKRS